MMIGKRRWRRRGNRITAAFVPPPPSAVHVAGVGGEEEREEIREKQGCKRIEATEQDVDDLLRCQRRWR